MKYKTFEEIPVWLDSHQLTLRIYQITTSFPKEEKFSLTSQIRRSMSSIPANIAEGFYRRTTKELLTFLYNSRGSAGETRYHLILSKDLGYINDSNYLQLRTSIDNVIAQLSGWIKSLTNLKEPRK